MQASPRSRSRGPGRRASRGFTLVETLIAVGIAGVLSGIAYPSLESQVTARPAQRRAGCR